MSQRQDRCGGRPAGRPRGTWLRRVAAALLACLALAAPAPADDRSVEYGVKAVFLERFARFVEWPSGALGEAPAPFVITVLGDDPFGGLLEKAYASRPVRGRPVQVQHARTLAEVGPCHLLFVSPSMARGVDEVVAAMRHRPVLLVGDTRGYGEAGAHLNFYLDDGKVHFELNAGALRATGLGVSYLLQQVARPVETRGGDR